MSWTRSLLLRTRSLAAWAIAASLLTTAATLAAQSAVAGAAAVTELGVAGRTNANPTVAARDKFVAVAWSAAAVSGMDIMTAVSTDGGVTFGAPVQVNKVAGDARVSGEMPPQVALVPRAGKAPEMLVVWSSRSGSTWALHSARSLDGGRTYSAAVPVPGSVGAGARGWQSVAVDSRGRVTVLWLDHRAVAAADSVHRHTMPASATAPATSGAAAPAAQAPAMTMPKADPTARAALSAVYVAPLSGGKATVLTQSPCYCCKTALVADGQTLYAAWRHVFAGGERDIAFAYSANGGRTFSELTRVSDDHWKLDGCPDNGPALAVDRNHQVHAVWPTLDGGTSRTDLALFYASSRDGRRFSGRTRLPTRGPAGHVQVAVAPDGAPVIAWDEIVDGTRRLGVVRARQSANGTVSFAPLPIPQADGATGQWYPALTSSPAGVLAVWVRQQAKGSVIGVTRFP